MKYIICKILILLALTSCSKTSLIGNWESEKLKHPMGPDKSLLHLYKNHKFEFYWVDIQYKEKMKCTGTYSYSKNKIKFIPDPHPELESETTNVNYKLKNNLLVLSLENGVIKYHKYNLKKYKNYKVE